MISFLYVIDYKSQNVLSSDYFLFFFFLYFFKILIFSINDLQYINNFLQRIEN